jgi:hypothetical protein
MTNCGPNGSQLNHELARWALEHFAGVVQVEPEILALDDDALAAYTGSYETVATQVEISAGGGRLSAQVIIKPEMAAALSEAGQEPGPQPPIPLGMVAGDGDRFVVPDGPAKGLRGYFRRDDGGQVDGVHLGGRLAARVRTTA